MKFRSRYLLVGLCGLFLASAPSFAKLAKYAELQGKDYDEMMKIVNAKIAASHKAGLPDPKNKDDEGDDQEAIDELREGVRIVLARPDKDNQLSELIAPLRHELTQYDAYEEVMVKVVTDAISAVSDSHLSVGDRATYFFVLRNAMSEMKPEFNRKPIFKKLLENIRDAKIHASADVRTELMMPSMYNLESPSETAKTILAHPPPLAPNNPSEPTSPEPSASATKKKRSIEVF